MNSEDGQVYSVCILQFSCSTKYNCICSQNINKQNVNIADETLTYYSFLSWYHCSKSKNYLKRRYRIRHWIPMFFGTPCTMGKLPPTLHLSLNTNYTYRVSKEMRTDRRLSNRHLYMHWIVWGLQIFKK